MSLVRLLGFRTLSCGCVIGRYRELATSREVSYVEEKGTQCELHGHRRNHTIPEHLTPVTAGAVAVSRASSASARAIARPRDGTIAVVPRSSVLTPHSNPARAIFSFLSRRLPRRAESARPSDPLTRSSRRRPTTWVFAIAATTTRMPRERVPRMDR